MDPKEIRNVKEEANELARKGKYEEAIKLFTKLTQWDKREVQHHIKIAELYGKLNKPADKIKWYETAARKYAEQGHLPKAIAMAKIVLGVDPKHQATLAMLSDFYAKKEGAQKSAATLLGAAVTAAPTRSIPREPEMQPVPEPAPVPAAARSERPQEVVQAYTATEIEVEIDDGVTVAIPHVPLFSDLSAAEFERFIAKLEVQTYQPDEYVIAEGEAGDAFYVITRGVATVAKEDFAGLTLKLAELADDAFFGEFAYLSGTNRTASVIAKTELEVLCVSRAVMDEIVAEYPRVREVLQEFYKERVLNTLLAISPLFEPFSQDQKREVIENFVYEECAANVTVLQEGTDARGLYVVMNGEVEVVREGERLSSLGAGEFFGEMSLLTDQPTNATVRTTQKTSVFVLPAERFRPVASSYPELVGIMSAFAVERRNQNQSNRQFETMRGERGLV